jgi:hypothetical protein
MSLLGGVFPNGMDDDIGSAAALPHNLPLKSALHRVRKAVRYTETGANCSFAPIFREAAVLLPIWDA